jgi:cytochrome c oxidase subunit II
MSSSPGARPTRQGLVFIGGLVAAAVVVLTLYVTGAGARIVESLYPPAAVTEQGKLVRELYNIVFLIAAAIFFLVEGLIVWTIIAYRRKPTDTDLPPQTHGNSTAEIIWTVVPTLIVAFLFVVSWQTLNTVDATNASTDTKIRAVAGQFQWTFEYMPASYDPASKDPALNAPDPLYIEYAPTGRDAGLHVPTGRPIHLYLTSLDVIHAFYVPQFLFKRDVVPGRVNSFEFNVTEDQAGQTFSGQCAELCGSGHRLMLFDVNAMSGADYDAWLKAKIESASASPEPQPSGPAPSDVVPSGAPGQATELTVVAQGIAFTTPTLEAPVNSPITIKFDNQDAGTPHNIKIFKDSIGGQVVFEGKIFPGVATETYDVGPLAKGTYPFECFVHPNMTGTLTVQ